MRAVNARHIKVVGLPPTSAGMTGRGRPGHYGHMSYYVYILASKPHGTLYVGVTNDLVRRVHEHRTGAVKGFTKEYGVHQLVYFETSDSVESAIEREKHIKKWERAWKIELIESSNPRWADLFPTLTP